MILQRFYPGLRFTTFVAFIGFLGGLGMVLFREGSDSIHGTIALAVATIGLGILSGASWSVRTSMEVGFHLQEELNKLKSPSSGSESRQDHA